MYKPLTLFRIQNLYFIITIIFDLGKKKISGKTIEVLLRIYIQKPHSLSYISTVISFWLILVVFIIAGISRYISIFLVHPFLNRSSILCILRCHMCSFALCFHSVVPYSFYSCSTHCVDSPYVFSNILCMGI